MAENCSSASSGGSGSGLELSDADVQKIVQALRSGLPGPASFHIFEFSVGLLLAVVLAGLLYYKSRSRLNARNRQKDAIETLKDMDDATIKRMLGETNLPSWVNFPDFERVGWTNKILSQLWPFVNSAVSQQFRELLGPLLRDNKPAWIASLKLFRFDLGDAAPQANGVKVYSSDEADEEIILEVDFSWVGNQDVQLTMKPIPKHLGPLSPAGAILSSIIRLRAGIERIIVNGRVRIMFKPLLGELPIIAGMQVALVEMPKFSFDVTMYGGDVSLVPGLEKWLTQFMKDTVFRPYILPERYSVPFTEAADEEIARPKAILFLKFVGATHVPKMDLFSQSDAYVRFSVRHTVQLRTSTKDNDANPTWNESFKLLVHDPEAQKLTCVLMDYDDFNPDDEIGRCVLPLRDLSQETQDFWLDVDMEADNAAADGDHQKASGIIGTLIEAEQKVADQGEKLWKKLPGIKQKDKRCQIHLQATMYMLEGKDLEDAMADAPREARPTSPQDIPTTSSDNQPTQDSVGHKGGKGGKIEFGGNMEEEEREAALHNGGISPGEGEDHGDGRQMRRAQREAGDGDNDEQVQGSVRSQALDALRGGILYVKPRKAEGLTRKPWYKGSFLHSSAQLEVTVCGQHKSSTAAKTSNPVFNETLEFLLGGEDIRDANKKRLKIEIWDHRLRLSHFRGGCSLLLKDVLDAKRIKNTLRLSGVRHGEISLEVYWVSTLETNKHGATRTKAIENDT